MSEAERSRAIEWVEGGTQFRQIDPKHKENWPELTLKQPNPTYVRRIQIVGQRTQRTGVAALVGPRHRVDAGLAPVLAHLDAARLQGVLLLWRLRTDGGRRCRRCRDRRRLRRQCDHQHCGGRNRRRRPDRWPADVGRIGTVRWAAATAVAANRRRR